MRRARRFIVCIGSHPMVPAIPGLHDVPFLTDDTLDSVERVPGSLLVFGGGPIGAEVAQGFSRLGAQVTIVHADAHLLPHVDPEAGRILEEAFRDEGIAVYNHRALRRVDGDEQRIVARTDHGETLTGETLFIDAGRTLDTAGLALERAGVSHDPTGIRVDRYLRTSARTIYAAGDCIAGQPLSHGAVHQGRIALLNAILPRPLARDGRRALVPWIVHTDPPVAYVGRLERELRATGMDYEVHEERCEEDGPRTAGGIRAFLSSTGRIYGVRILGGAAPEMIHEWALAMRQGIRIQRVLLLPHAFPSMSLLGPRIAERWLVRRLEHPLLRRLLCWRFGTASGRRRDGAGKR
jgi:pyruvate/2-oxoglutarate dehydrogenase complex dihydrolipoamide dehydrogenase (E3) component